jgi:formamidopyrimidine-DNA glycosylase
MDQQVIAGIGNVYADEILFQAHIHPRRGIDALGPRILDRLFASMRKVLLKAIAAGADAGCPKCQR